MRWIISEKSLEERKKLGRELDEETMKHIEVLPQNKLDELKQEETFLTCAKTKNTSDAVEGTCVKCGCKIYFQPYNKKIKNKYCDSCTEKMMGRV